MFWFVCSNRLFGECVGLGKGGGGGGLTYMVLSNIAGSNNMTGDSVSNLLFCDHSRPRKRKKRC